MVPALLAACMAAAPPAAPLPPPPPPEVLVEKAAVIVVAEYTGYDKTAPNTFAGGAVAEFKVVSVLKGGKLPDQVRVEHSFCEGVCIPDPKWTFGEDKLPKVGSTWVLFLTPPEKAKAPFRPAAKWAGTEANVALVTKLVAEQR